MRISFPTLAEMAAALASGRVSSTGLVEEALERIAQHQAAGGCAFIEVDAEGVRRAAQQSDAARAAGRASGLLEGIPVSIKDLFDVAGQRTRAGSVVLNDRPPAAVDALAVARLRAAGAILVGRTNMSEFAFSGVGLNPHYGTPRAPFDETRIAGGSSSGAAVSVALGLSAAALGSDTGGSIRIPAAFCGLTGFKPTARRVPRDGVIPLSTSLDSVGPLGRSVACCALMDRVLSGEALVFSPLGLKGLKLYVTDDYVMDEVETVVARAFEATLQILARQGARIVRFAFPELKTLPAINAGGGFAAAESWHWHRTLLADKEAQYDPRVARRIHRGARQSAADYLDLLAARIALQKRAASLLQEADAWLMPTVPVVPPRLEAFEQDDDFYALNSLILRNPSVVNFLDGCAVSLPGRVENGAGVGLSLCGLSEQDAHILRIADAVECALRKESQ